MKPTATKTNALLLVLLCSCPVSEPAQDGRLATDAKSSDGTTPAIDGNIVDHAQLVDAGDAANNANDANAVDVADANNGEADECENMATLHSEWLWCDGFEQEQDLHARYPDIGSNGFAVSTQDSFEGQHAIQQHYDVGQVDAGWVFFFYADALGRDYGPIHDEIYARWYHKFEPGFSGWPPKMARISSIGPGFEKRFAVHHWVNEQGFVVADVHVPYSSQANSSGWLPVARSTFSFADSANIGRWICHEMYIKTNTAGQSDGAYRFWADGTVIVERSNVDLRGDTSFNFNAVQLDSYWNNGSPADQNRYYDNFVVSAERIGCR